MEVNRFVRKYIDLMRYDTPQNSLPFILMTLCVITVKINMLITLFIEPGNFEKTFFTVVDFFLGMIMYCHILNRIVYDEEMTKLIELIEDDFVVSCNDLPGRDELWQKIDNYYQKKRKQMTLSSKLLIVFVINLWCMGSNKNLMIYLLGPLTDVDNVSDWPTPYLSYSPPELRSPIFFIYTYILHNIIYIMCFAEAFVALNSVNLSTERILADFDTLFMLLDDIVNVYPHYDYNHNVPQTDKQQDVSDHSYSTHTTQTANLRRDMALITKCHQTLIRNFKVCADGSGFLISMVYILFMLYSCEIAYLMLKSNDTKKAAFFAMSFLFGGLMIFSIFRNGQRVFNQNDNLRSKLTELPWLDKPHWFKTTVHLMMTRANVDIEMRPFGIYSLNYMSFKDLVKMAFSVGNLLYTQKVVNQSKQ